MPARINTPRNRQQSRRLAAADFYRRQQQKRTDPLRALIDSLFGNGEQGLFWLPRPTVLGEQALWQQSDGTIIVNADGDPIGRGEDVSGNDNDLTQPVSADRPLYWTDGSKHWVQFDGAGDFISSDIVYQGDFYLCTAFRNRSAPSPDSSCVFSTADGGVTATFQFGVESGNFKIRYDAFKRLDTGAPEDTNIHIVECWRTGGVTYLAMDGNTLVSSTEVINKFETFKLSMNRGGANSLDSDNYGVVLVLSATDQAAREMVRTYLAKQAGITL